MEMRRPYFSWLVPMLVFALLLLMMAACGGGDTGDSGGRAGRTKKDRGEAAMTIGGAAWQSTSASARLTDGKLTIKASNNDLSDGAMKRQELHLLVTEFRGAGDYETAMSGSRFLTVGFDTETAKQADGDDAAAQNAIQSALKGATHMTLAGAKVKVTSSDDTEIVGTFSWQPPEGSKQPAIEGGTFRAKVK